MVRADTIMSSAMPGYLEHFPHLAGQTFGDLSFWFDDAIVLALVNRRTGLCEITPDPNTVVSTGQTDGRFASSPGFPANSCVVYATCAANDADSLAA
jgi:hypothetical protein